MKKLFLLIALFLGIDLYSQVAINTDGTSPDASAMLDVKSTTGGLLIPRMSFTQRNAIASPATGLLVYQTNNSPGFYYNAGTPASPSWVYVGSGFGWSLTGNAGTSSPNNFIGTTDDVPLNFRINSAFAGRIERAQHNLSLGYLALAQNTTGTNSTALGYSALYNNKANSRSTAMGFYAMFYADDRTSGRETFNTAIGCEALRGSSTPADNTGQYNTAVGDQALFSNTSGNGNIAMGYLPLFCKNTGRMNFAFGYCTIY